MIPDNLVPSLAYITIICITKLTYWVLGRNW